MLSLKDFKKFNLGLKALNHLVGGAGAVAGLAGEALNTDWDKVWHDVKKGCYSSCGCKP
jgi:hypothetical protein